ncbi:tail fiber domain-containing protein [Escherichia coli]
MIYTTGTIAINGNTVKGTGTNFSEPLSLIRVGCTLIAISNPIQIFTVTEIKSGTELSVTPAANPAIAAGTKFSILLSDSISVDGLAQDVAETLRYYQSKETEVAEALEWSQEHIADKIGLGAERRDWPDCNDPTGYVGFCRAEASKAKNFPPVASGETYLVGWLSRGDGTVINGCFVGTSTRSLYTYSYNSLNKSVAWARHARKDEVDRLVQRTGETRVYAQDANKFLTIYDSGSWGYFDGVNSKWLPLTILAGGTGATSLDDAKKNLQIPEGGLTKTITINAPEGMEDGKYYPIVVFTGDMNGAGSFPCPVEIVTAGGNASSPMNSNTFSGYVRCGGWSDIKNIAYGYYVSYEPSEVAILCIKASLKDYAQHIAFYVSNKAFPIKIQVGYKAKVTVPTSDYVLGSNGVKFKFGVSTSEEDNGVNNVANVLDFTGGGSGFYSNAIFRQGYSTNFALTNKLNTSDPFIVTMPSFTVLGAINCTKGFVAYGEDVNNRTLISRRTNAAGNQTLDQSEFRAAEKTAQIVVRDMTAAAKHTFFNFNGDGTFSAPGGMVTHTGSDWNGQHSDNVNKFKPLAGPTNSPDGTMVVGGFHAQFSGSYATQFAGRDSKFYARSIEAGVEKGWRQLATLNNNLVQRWTGYQEFKSTDFYADTFSRKLSLSVRNTAAKNVSFELWGSETRPTVLECVTSEKYLFYAQNNTDDSCQFQVNGVVNCTTLNQSSDRDLKDNIQVISDATEAIRKMNGYTYTLKENGLPYAGIIAQEVMEALPEAVGSFTHYGEALQGPTTDGNELREETRYLNVDYAAVTGLLVQVARETDNRVTELEEENASLRANIAAMDERIAKLEALVRQLTGSEE